MKTKGFTLVETMVALLLISLSFGIWMMVFATVDFNQSGQRLHFSYQIDAEFSNIIKEESYFNLDYMVDHIAYSRSITIEENDDYLIIELIAFYTGEEVGRRKEIVYLP